MRRELLNVSLNTENNVEATINQIERADVKFLNRKLTKLQDEAEDAEKALEDRLATNAVIDESVVENLYAEVWKANEKIELYEAFLSYYTNEDNAPTEDNFTVK